MPRIGFILLLFTSALLHAQETVELAWTEERSFDREMDFNHIVGTQGDLLLVLSTSSSLPQNSVHVRLDLYDKESMKFVRSHTICDNRSNFGYEDIVITKNFIHLFTSFYDRNLGFEILSVQTYDEEKQAFSEPERIDEVFSDDKDKHIPFMLTVSPDGNYVLIYHDNLSRSGNKKLNMKVINEDFTAVWEKEIELNYKDRMVEIRNIIIDDNSTVYLLTSINPYGIKRSLGFGALLNIKNTLFTYRPYDDKLKEMEFALTRNWINSVSMELDQNQHLMATAYYTYPNDYKVRGFVMMKLHKASGSMIQRKMITLDKDQYKTIEQSIDHLKETSKSIIGSAGIYPGTSSHMNNTSTEFNLKDIIVHQNGYVLAIEALRRDERCTESFNEQQMIVNCEKHFLYGDVLLFFMSTSGDIKQIKRVEKMQHSVDKLNPHYSFSITGHDERLFLIYNDDIRNAEITEEDPTELKPLRNMRKADLEVIVLDESGEIKEMGFSETEDENTAFLPGQYQWLDDSALLLYSQRNKNYKFGKLRLLQ